MFTGRYERKSRPYRAISKMSETSLLLKHYCLLRKNIDSLSDGQARIREAETDTEEEDSLTHIVITLSPRSGPYRGGQFDFELDLSEGYPTYPPMVRSQTLIYHPNVDCSFACDSDDEGGDVCMNILDELWTPTMTLEDVIQGLLFLLHEPNLEDPLSCMFNGSEDEEEFRRNVRRTLRGGVTIDNIYFERNLLDGYDSECEDKNEGAPAVNQDTGDDCKDLKLKENNIILVPQSHNDETMELPSPPEPSSPPSPPPPPPPPLPLSLMDTVKVDTQSLPGPTDSTVEKMPSLTLFFTARHVSLHV